VWGLAKLRAERSSISTKIDEQGLIRWANLVIATGLNNLAMNRSVLQVAKPFVRGKHLAPAMLNRVEAVIRCCDPCLSCSTHALGPDGASGPVNKP
jgi:NAD-reducing hydrogenase large subunit